MVGWRSYDTKPFLKKKCDYWATQVFIGGKSWKTDGRWPMIVDNRLNITYECLQKRYLQDIDLGIGDAVFTRFCSQCGPEENSRNKDYLGRTGVDTVQLNLFSPNLHVGNLSVFAGELPPAAFQTVRYFSRNDQNIDVQRCSSQKSEMYQGANILHQ